MVNAVVSTGALMAHGFIESAGMTHFKYKFGQMKDEELYQKNSEVYLKHIQQIIDGQRLKVEYL